MGVSPTAFEMSWRAPCIMGMRGAYEAGAQVARAGLKRLDRPAAPVGLPRVVSCLLLARERARRDRGEHAAAVRAVAPEGVEARVVLRAAWNVLDTLVGDTGFLQLGANGRAQVHERLVALLAHDEAEARR